MIEVPVEELTVGQHVALPNGGSHPVVRIGRYDDGSFVVVYASNTLNSWENRAQDKGRWQQTTVDGLEKSLRKMHAGDVVHVDDSRRLRAVA